MLDHDVAQATRRTHMPIRVLFTLSIAIGMVGAMVGVASGPTTAMGAPSAPDTTAVAPPNVYIPVIPNRLLDTRYNNGLSGPFMSRVARTFQVTNRNPTNSAINI